MDNCIKILIADADEGFTSDLACYLKTASSFDVVGAANDGEKAVRLLRAAQPNAIVYVEANLHVGPSRSSTDATFNNPRIDKLNEKLAALADGKTIFYIDINELFDDENGNLRADASGDSTHVYAKYDLDWCDWLCTKAIVR